MFEPPHPPHFFPAYATVETGSYTVQRSGFGLKTRKKHD
jgi:hypothetical protein